MEFIFLGYRNYIFKAYSIIKIESLLKPDVIFRVNFLDCNEIDDNIKIVYIVDSNVFFNDDAYSITSKWNPIDNSSNLFISPLGSHMQDVLPNKQYINEKYQFIAPSEQFTIPSSIKKFNTILSELKYV